MRRALPTLLLLGAGTLPRAQEATQAAGDLRVHSMRIAEIDADHLRIEAHLAIVPSTSATLTAVRWSGMRLNGVPIFADPMDAPVALHKGQPAELPPLYLTVMVRDLSTTAPLRDAVQNGHAHIEGEAVAALQLNFLEKLALHTQQPRVRIPFSTEVPVEIPGGVVGRRAALGILHVADGAMAARNASGKLPYLRPEWREHAEMEARQNLLAVESVYQLQTKGSAAGTAVSITNLGFRAGGRTITTAEAGAPWQFDPDFLTRIKSREVEVAPESLRVTVRQDFGESTGQVTAITSLQERGPQTKDALIVGHGSYATIQLRRRATPGAVLLLGPASGQAGWPMASPAVTARASWQGIVFRLHAGPGHVSVETIALIAERDANGGLRFDHPVDASAFGSPILTPEGVIGMVQDERAGTLLTTDLLAH